MAEGPLEGRVLWRPHGDNSMDDFRKWVERYDRVSLRTPPSCFSTTSAKLTLWRRSDLRRALRILARAAAAFLVARMGVHPRHRVRALDSGPRRVGPDAGHSQMVQRRTAQLGREHAPVPGRFKDGAHRVWFVLEVSSKAALTSSAAEPKPGEGPRYVRTSYADLYDRVARLARALRRRGVGPGDVVAAYGPNCSALVVALLATSSIGAIWSSMGADFGPSSVLCWTSC